MLDIAQRNEAMRAGLSTSEAQRRLAEAGPNEIVREASQPWWRLLVAQFSSPVVLLLFGACLLSASLGEIADAIAIGSIVIINALVGFFQEYRAERAVLALRSMTAPRARVIRDGRMQTIAASEVVPGDLLVLEGGDIVAADARVVEANVLTTLEAPLTGESTPVEKHTTPTVAETPLAERHDYVFLGTSVAAGTGLAEVTATGMRSELGRIAHLLTTAQEESTPLQKRLAALSRLLMYACLAIVIVVAAIGWLRDMPALEILMSAVSLAVAAVPEGLPAIVTIALAVGMRRIGGTTCAAAKTDGRRDFGFGERHLHGQNGHAHDGRHGRQRALGRESQTHSRCGHSLQRRRPLRR